MLDTILNNLVLASTVVAMVVLVRVLAKVVASEALRETQDDDRVGASRASQYVSGHAEGPSRSAVAPS